MPEKSGTASAPRAAVNATANAAATSKRKSRPGVFMIASLAVRLQMNIIPSLARRDRRQQDDGARRDETVSSRVLQDRLPQRPRSRSGPAGFIMGGGQEISFMLHSTLGIASVAFLAGLVTMPP